MAEHYATFQPHDGGDHQRPLRITTIGIDFDYEGEYRCPAGSDEWLFVCFLSDTEAQIDGASLACPAGTFLAWEPGQSLHYGRRGQGFRHHWIRCVGHQVGTWYESCGLPYRQPLQLPWPEHGCDAPWRSLRDEFARGPGAHDEILAHLLRIVFMHVERSRLDQAPPTPGPLLRAKWHIDARFRQGIDVEGMATIAGLSKAHFSTRFSEAFGQSPMAYCIGLRMQHAALLLANADLRVAQVAAAVGYDDPFHFSKLFRKHHGRSPRAYRKTLIRQG